MAEAERPQDMVSVPQAMIDHLVTTGRPSRAEFKVYFKGRKLPGNAHHGYSAMLQGRPVERTVAQSMVDLMQQRQIDLGAVSLLPADPTAWRSWPGIREALFRIRKKDDKSRVRDAQTEMPLIAEAILTESGRLNYAVDDLTDLERGQQAVSQTVGELAGWLTVLHRRDTHAVMYAVDVRGRQVSAVVSFATTAAVYARICAGTMRDIEIGPDDLVSDGKHVLQFAVAPLPDETKVSPLGRAAAELHRFFFMGGYFTRGLRPFRPVVYCPGGTPLFVARLERHGYVRTGAVMKGSQMPMMVLRHRSEAADQPADRRPDARQVRAYRAMRWIALGYRQTYARRWCREAAGR